MHSVDPRRGRLELAQVLVEHVGASTGLFLRQQQDADGVYRYADVLVQGLLKTLAAMEGNTVSAGSAHDASETVMRARRGRWSLRSPAPHHTNRFSTFHDDVDSEQLDALPVMQEIYRPHGIIDQARMMVIDKGRVLARFGLLNTEREGPFTKRELKLLNRSAQAIAHAFVCLDMADQWEMDNGVAMVRADGAVVAATPDVAKWLVARRRELLVARIRAIDSGQAPMFFGLERALVRVTRLDGPEGVHYLLTFRSQQPEVSPANRLTLRQRDIADLAAVGMTVEEIAATLHISANTVKTHLRAVYDILYVANRVELARALATL